MTVGLGVICEYGDCVVLASDLRVTYRKMKITPHERAGKQYSFPPFNFAAAIAGSTSSSHAIVSELSGQLQTLIRAWLKARKKHPKVQIQWEHIRNAIEAARKRELRRLQSCEMDSELGVSVRDWIAGKLPTGQPFNEYAHREGLRVLKRVKEEMQYKSGIIVAGFLRDKPLFCRGIGANPLEEGSSPAIYVIGGQGAVDAQQVLHNRNQNIEMGIARTILHVYEALRAARNDKGVGDPSGYIIIRPHTAPRPNGMLRIKPDHPMLEQWRKQYRLRDTQPLETRFANDLVNRALEPAKAKKAEYLGDRNLMPEL